MKKNIQVILKENIQVVLKKNIQVVLKEKLFLNRNFTLLWLGQLVSLFGDKFYLVALSWWVLEKTGSASVMGLIMICSTVPGIIASFFSGYFIDSGNRKNTLICCDFIRGSVMLLNSALMTFNMLEIHHVIFAAVLVSVCSAFFSPAAQSIYPLILEKKEIKNGQSLSEFSYGLTSVMGPVMGSLLTGLLGVGGIFFINGLSFIISGISECFIRLKEMCRENSQSFTASFREGIAFIAKTPSLLSVMVIIGAVHFFVGGFQILIPVASKTISPSDPVFLGIAQSALGMGFLIGAATSKIVRGRYFRIIVNISFLMGMSFVFSALTIESGTGAEILFPFSIAVTGFLISNASVFWNTLLHEKTPIKLSGRIFSFSNMLGSFSVPIAFGVAGTASENIGTSNYLMISGFALSLTIAVIMLVSKEYRGHGSFHG